MAFVAVNKDGSELITSPFPPERELEFYEFWQESKSGCSYNIIPQTIALPKGTIEKLIGKKLTWEDEPVELKEEN